MKIYVKETLAKTLPTKAASMLSFYVGQNAGEQRLLIGTYQLEEEGPVYDKSERCGGICVVNPTNFDIEQHIRLPCGVFRLIKVPSNIKNENSAVSIAALTDGRLALLGADNFNSDDKSSSLFLSYSPTLSDGMLLDCALNCDGRLLCSDNLGNLCLLRFAMDGFDSVDFQWRAHSSQFGGDGTMDSCEVWSCCWTDNEQCCASGGEDAILRIWDIRCHRPASSRQCNAQLTNRSHSAGVVFVASSDSLQTNWDGGQRGAAVGVCPSSSPNLLLSGCYDDSLRAFDLRQFDHPISEIKLNGGVWDVQRLTNDLLLAACMYGGWSIVRDFPFPLELMHAHSVNGQQLLYAATSVSPLPFIGNAGGDSSMAAIASCTFNDAMLRMENVTFIDA